MLIFHRYNYKVEIDSHDLNNLTMKSMDQVFFPFFLKNKKKIFFQKENVWLNYFLDILFNLIKKNYGSQSKFLENLNFQKITRGYRSYKLAMNVYQKAVWIHIITPSLVFVCFFLDFL